MLLLEPGHDTLPPLFRDVPPVEAAFSRQEFYPRLPGAGKTLCCSFLQHQDSEEQWVKCFPALLSSRALWENISQKVKQRWEGSRGAESSPVTNSIQPVTTWTSNFPSSNSANHENHDFASSTHFTKKSVIRVELQKS